MYKKILQNVIFPVSTYLTNRKFWTIYRQLMSSQYYSKDRIRDIQLRKLKLMVTYAYNNVPMYTRLMDNANIKPSDIKTLSDIKKMPIVTKTDFRKMFPNQCTSKIVPKNAWIMDSTSGSTGSPFQFIRDKHFSDNSLANTYRNYTWTGMEIGDPIVSLWGFHESSMQVKALDTLLRRRFISSFDVDTNYKKYHSVIKKYNPKLIEAYSASLLHFAKLLKKEGLTDLYIPAAISSAETLYEENRKIIEEVLHTKVFNRYGSRELGGIAQECEQHKGLHINAESYIVEVVRSDKNSLKGRLIVTNLNNFTMPFIRYDTEDYGIESKDSCICGRGLPMLKSVEGRVVDFILLPDGKELSFLFFNYFFEQYGEYLKQFQVVQDTKKHLNIYLVTTKKYTKIQENAILKGIKSKIGNQMMITLKKVENIPLEKSGKHRPVKRLI